jgi:putative transcriptional regulator
MMRAARSWLQLALLFCGGVFASPGTDPLSAGMVLVATSNLHGTSFEKTIVLITQHDRQGTLGIAINRPANKKLSEFFPDLGTKTGDRPLYLGGPVRPYALFVLARTKAGEGWIPIVEDIYFTGGPIAQRFLKQNPSRPTEPRLQVFAGYTGWAAGQLENEMQRGDWLSTAADADMIFNRDPERIWERLRRLHSGKWI